MGSLNDLIVHGRQDNVRAPPPRGKKKNRPKAVLIFTGLPMGLLGPG